MSEFDRYNTLDDLDKGDELERYLREERVAVSQGTVIHYDGGKSTMNGIHYPVLQHLPIDTLAAPASSSGDEHVFSMAGLVLDDEHFNTKSGLAEVQQCLKSYETAGLYRGALEDQSVRPSARSPLCAFAPLRVRPSVRSPLCPARPSAPSQKLCAQFASNKQHV